MDSIGAQEGLRHHRPGMLRDLIPEVSNLEMRGSSVFATYRYKVPVTEYGIPNRDLLIRGAIAAAGGKLDWDGIYDDHHLAWPKCSYRGISSVTIEELGRKYRSLNSLRFWGPRQLHEYLHVGFSVPLLPELDIMAQYVAEESALRGLQSILRCSERERIEGRIDLNAEVAREKRYRDRITILTPGELGHLPDMEYLKSLRVATARREIGRRVRLLTFNDVLNDMAIEQAETE